MSLHPIETDRDVIAEAVTAGPPAGRSILERLFSVGAFVCFTALAVCGALAFIAVAEQLVGVR